MATSLCVLRICLRFTLPIVYSDVVETLSCSASPVANSYGYMIPSVLSLIHLPTNVNVQYVVGLSCYIMLTFSDRLN